jgi:hypothetical protein
MRPNAFLFALAQGVLLSAANLAQAAPPYPLYVLQPDEPESKDVFVYEFLPTWNFETSGDGFRSFLGSSETSTAHDTNTLIEFDLTGVDASAYSVARATLNLYTIDGEAIFGGANGNPSASYPVGAEVYALGDSWVEDTIVWNSKPPTTGGLVDAITIDGIDAWFSFDVTRLVQRWLTGGLDNNGMLISQTAEVIDPSIGKVAAFYDSSFAENKPFLTIQMGPPMATSAGPISIPSVRPVPEPGSVLLLTAFALLAGRLRRAPVR